MKAASVEATNRRALLIFSVVLLLVMLVSSLSVAWLQRAQLHESMRDEMQTELMFLGELSTELLLRSDYVAVERLIQTWFARRDYVLGIDAVMPNGFVLTEQHRSIKSTDVIRVELPVVFKGQTLMTLRAEADFSQYGEAFIGIVLKVGVLSVLLVGILGWVLWLTLQRSAFLPLAALLIESEDKEKVLQQQRSQLEAALKELESFSYSVSHDLRAPLRAIDGFSRALEEDYTDVLDEGARDYLTRIRKGTQRMGRLIDDLLELSRVGRAELRPVALDLSTMAQDILDKLASENSVRRVKVEISPGLSTWGDAGLLQVALFNLLENAWKYTSKTADAHIVVNQQDIDGQRVFEVRDNGAGFDMQYAGKLFGAFQRLHGAEFPGTGIGLATVQRIVHRHGGRVWAKAEVGQGASFFFTLAAGDSGQVR